MLLLQEMFRQRPFVDEELWAGKIRALLDQHPKGFSTDLLARATGLDHFQIERADAWQNKQDRMWRAQFQDLELQPGE